jgi:WD40 repeat protein
VYGRSSITYSGHGGGVTALCVIDNSHSVASASVDGQVHVWRVELACSTSKRRPKDPKDGAAGSTQSGTAAGQSQVPGSGLTVRALSVVRTLDPGDGCVTALQHFTDEMASVVAFSTQRGTVAGWDLRSSGTPFRYNVRPEFGVPTCMTLPPNSAVKGWIMVGTSRGYLIMWDTRFNLMSAAWKHSSNGPIHKIECIHSHSALEGSSPFPLSPGPDEDDDAYDTLETDMSSSKESIHRKMQDEAEGRGCGDCLMVAAGCNEVALWTLPIPRGGMPIVCFRATPVANSRDKGRDKDIPRLFSVTLPNHPHAPVHQAISTLLSAQPSPPGPSMRSFLCGGVEGRAPYVITGGTDGLLRHWDWTAPSRCGVLSGLSPAQHRPAILSVRWPLHRAGEEGSEKEESLPEYADRTDRKDAMSNHSGSTAQHRMFVCYDTAAPSASNAGCALQALLPLRDSKGTAHSPTTSQVLYCRIHYLTNFRVSCPQKSYLRDSQFA